MVLAAIRNVVYTRLEEDLLLVGRRRALVPVRYSFCLQRLQCCAYQPPGVATRRASEVRDRTWSCSELAGPPRHRSYHTAVLPSTSHLPITASKQITRIYPRRRNRGSRVFIRSVRVCVCVCVRVYSMCVCQHSKKTKKNPFVTFGDILFARNDHTHRRTEGHTHRHTTALLLGARLMNIFYID